MSKQTGGGVGGGPRTGQEDVLVLFGLEDIDEDV